jgi:ribosome maturation factor RimP
MIQVETVRSYLQDELPKRGLFLVDVIVSPGNRITVHADSMKGITIEECIAVSRFIESRFNRETEDYELEVSSPGLENPIKQPEQYQKNLGRWLDVITFDGLKTTGKLVNASAGSITLEIESIERDVLTRKKVVVKKIFEKRIDEIKAAKIVISLKK